MRDYSRLGMLACERFRILKQSEKYEICPTYPKAIVVPASLSDKEVSSSCAFRSRKRIPVAVWMHPKNGAILARCAQPLVGLRNTRCKEDEKLVSGLMLRVNLDSPADTSDSNSTGSEIEETEYNSSSPDSDSSEVDGVTQFVTDVWSTFNNWNNGGNSNTISRESSLHSNDGKNDSARPAVDPASENERSTGLGDSTTSKIRLEEEFFYIVDARSQMATMGNRALGKGTENPANYTGARLLYMCIDNIHSVRGAFSKLVEIAQPSFNGDFERSLADCGWLYQVRNILVSSVKIVRHVDQHEKSVLTHCSDGWDRTAQMVSMAELLLDPWYRTRSGFAELVEKEWCGFGHKFRDRYGHGVDALSDHEFSPVFTLWIDCVWQVTRQFPTAFEFNERFLTALVDSVYSGRYGTFLANSEKERENFKVQDLTESIWPTLLIGKHFLNTRYQRVNRTLYPSCQSKNIKLWESFYFRFDPTMA